MARPSKEIYYLGIAEAVCKRSTCLKRRYGAVIVNNDEVVSTGYNGNPRTLENCSDTGICHRLDKPHNSGDYSDCHSVHAEQNAMLSASRKDMIGATLYLYGEEATGHEYLGDKITRSSFVPVTGFISPCPICARMLINCGIKDVVVPNGFGFKHIDIKEIYKSSIDYFREKK